MNIFHLIFIFHYLCFNYVNCCYIHGTDSGICSEATLNSTWKAENMPYCGQFVNYPACLPKQQSIAPSLAFANGRWYSYNVSTKDTWIHDTTERFIMNRTHFETSKKLYRENRNEYGDRGHIIHRFYKRGDCRHAFRSYMCYINFPRCDMEREISLPTCRSACENFFRSCQYSHDLWRCGKAKYFNGYGPESPQMIDGEITYLRDYYPGQPFRQNKYNKDGEEMPICTPAIKGSAFSSVNSRNHYVILIALVSCIVSILIYV